MAPAVPAMAAPAELARTTPARARARGKAASYRLPRPAGTTSAKRKRGAAGAATTTATLPSPPCLVPSASGTMNADGDVSMGSAPQVLDEMTQRRESFVDLMNESDDVVVTQDASTPITRNQKEPKTKGPNYSIKEDESLVLAWEEVTLDPVAGNDQEGDTYWARIAEKYNACGHTHRPIGSLQHCWGYIQECCSRWAGCLEQVEGNRPSGTVIQDEVGIAQVLYKQRDTRRHKNFSLFHCWELVKDNEKWKTRNDTPIPTFKTPGKSSNSSSPDFDDKEEEETEGRGRSPTSSSRPPGRKQEKERVKKQEKGAVYKEVIRRSL
ncbi:hypothetical protein EJB05_34898, partial [Eragrostis curvula]